MQEQRQRRPRRVAWNIVIVASVLIALCLCFIFLLLKFLGINYGSSIANISYDIFTVIFIIAQFIFAYFQWLATRQWQQARQVTNASSSRNPRGISGVPSLTNSIVIQQRENIVIDVYAKLVHPLAKAVVLTGIVGNGKSTIAALVSEYAEKQRIDKHGPFTDEPIWLQIDRDAIISDIAGTIFNELHKPTPDLENLSAQNQAAVLYRALNEVNETRLIVLDQFDRLLDTQTGYIRADRPGIGEWLDAILSQPCKCRFLLTSRIWPRGPHGYDPTDENEYHIESLSDAEAKQLLRRQSDNRTAQSQPHELDRILVYCGNHPLALALLASHLKMYNLELTAFLNDPAHIKQWVEETASHDPDEGLSALYEMRLTSLQQRLLLAFSLFRKPAPRDAAQVVINFTVPMSGVLYMAEALLRFQIPTSRLLSDCKVLLRLYLLRAVYQDNYQLHPIVSAYAQYQFDRSSEEANEEMLQAAHAEAAKYYLQQAGRLKEPRSEGALRQSYIIEAIWHQCQSRQHQKAYVLLERENMFPNSRSEQEGMILLDLYQQLLPSKNWNPGPVERLHIYDNLGEICNALGKKQEALKYYREVLAISRDLEDYNMEQRTSEIITELSQRPVDR